MRQLVQHITDTLEPVYGRDEAREMAYWIIEETTGFTRSNILCGRALVKKTCKGTQNFPDLQIILERLLKKEPLQYIFGHTTWMGLDLHLNSDTLIPRPETAELVQRVREVIIGSAMSQQPLHICDIGTGSGCIAIALKKAFPACNVTACDISESALIMAQANAKANQAEITTFCWDVLSDDAPSFEYPFSVIVSNPPYICNEEKSAMDRNVLDYEPHRALFVPDSDPLLFYRRITMLSSNGLLCNNGLLAFEVNERFAKETAELMKNADFIGITIHTDIYGKERIVCGRKK